MTTPLLDNLRWRGLLHQCTDEAGLAAHFAQGPRRVYAGFDPTADSLTIGNLVPIMLLKHAQLAGHTPVVIIGGGTGLIGDPSGKSDERQLLTREDVEKNVASQRRIFERALSFEGENAAVIVNNADWLTKLGYIEVLRDVGKHFSVNAMIQRDSVRDRLQAREQGISYTEFSYAILQAYDFLHLFQKQGVTVQCGGSDQWGNIVAGIDLIKKSELRPYVDSGFIETGDRLGTASEVFDDWNPSYVFGFTAPLVTKADGGKFGKTESGAVWLTRERTSPYAYYQFWLNADDADASRFLRIFTLLSREEVEATEREQAADPASRAAQKALAREATRLIHADAGLAEAEAATQALFSGDVRALDEATLREAFAGAPSSEHPRTGLAGQGVALVDLLPETTLAKSKREAREFLAGAAVGVNGQKAGPDTRLGGADLLPGGVILLRRGKKHWHVTRWV